MPVKESPKRPASTTAKAKSPRRRVQKVILCVRPTGRRIPKWWPKDAAGELEWMTVDFNWVDGYRGYILGTDADFAFDAKHVEHAKAAWAEEHLDDEDRPKYKWEFEVRPA